MVRMNFKDDGNSLRDRIFDLLQNSRTSVEEDLVALQQCTSQIRNRLIIEQTAKECGFKLSRFITNDDLELYYDIKQGRHDFGYISKGWDDPGFRVGDLIKVPRANNTVLQTAAYKLLSFCAIQGVVLTIKETSEGVEIHMDSVIYKDGFNRKVFEQVLHHLNLCVERAETLLG